MRRGELHQIRVLQFMRQPGLLQNIAALPNIAEEKSIEISTEQKQSTRRALFYFINPNIKNSSLLQGIYSGIQNIYIPDQGFFVRLYEQSLECLANYVAERTEKRISVSAAFSEYTNAFAKLVVQGVIREDAGFDYSTVRVRSPEEAVKNIMIFEDIFSDLGTKLGNVIDGILDEVPPEVIERVGRLSARSFIYDRSLIPEDLKKVLNPLGNQDEKTFVIGSVLPGEKEIPTNSTSFFVGEKLLMLNPDLQEISSKTVKIYK